MDAEVLKVLKAVNERINELARRQEEFLIEKHDDNSEAIDDLTIAILGGEK